MNDVNHQQSPQALSLFNSKNSYDRSLARPRVWDESSGEMGNRDRQAVRRLYELVYAVTSASRT